jgi:hypothetical protein
MAKTSGEQAGTMFGHGFQAHTFRKIKPAEEKATVFPGRCRLY